MPRIYFIKEDITVDATEGITILEAARSVGIVIESPCDSIGTCGKCRVQLENYENSQIISKEVYHKLSKEEENQGYVLSCQTEVFGNITVLTNNTMNQNKSLKILSEGQSFSYEIVNHISKRYIDGRTLVSANEVILGQEEGDTTSLAFGLAIDIGTTTLVIALIDLSTGNEITSVSSLNPQSIHAQDVLTRIHIASKEEGRNQLYDSVVKEFNQLIDQIIEQSGTRREYIYEAVYSGNTAMIHLATGADPTSLGQYPYTPQIFGGNCITAKGQLDISPFGLIYLPPIISAYVGPDITSGIIASQLGQVQGTTLFIDIGTNGEMVLAKDGKLFATSTAAGPAFEGMNITHGMRAGNGAVELFRIREDCTVEIDVIGGVKARGICGSGILDIVGELVKHNIIGKNGKFVLPKDTSKGQSLKAFLIEKEGKWNYEVTEGVYLTQKDIRQIQLAKGAIRAGIEALLIHIGIHAEEVDTVEIAGSFGYHLREASLINIGLLPKEFAGKVKFVGNTSKSGGKALLLNTMLRENALKIVKEITVVELSKSEGFEKQFVNALSF